MAWKFDLFKIDLVWVEGNIQTITTDGATIDLGSGDLELDMQERTGDGEIDQGERVF